MKDNKKKWALIKKMAFFCIVCGAASPLSAQITGQCVNCHTMHNSQNNATMQLNGSTTVQPGLLRGSCLGCHGQATGQKIVNMNGSQVPQVLHSDASGDLAGGNFAYITGLKGTASNSHGHNVIDLGAAFRDHIFDSILPGGIGQSFHDGYIVNATNLTCAGTNGCHGYRYSSTVNFASGTAALVGAHHNNVDGQLTVADTAANSYRFLVGVKGYENQTDKWENKSASSHNEYYGATTPMTLGCSNTSCHGTNGVSPPNNTISGFCATCHGNFHTLKTTTSTGIGTTINSPFIRHPTDVVIPNSREYQYYTNYSVEAPVGRTTVPASASSVVTPGSDVVTCLSCHMSHASPYPDMLRWDYTTMVANGGGTGGCFTCHSQKN